MKSRPAPSAAGYRLPRGIANDPQVKKWAQRLRGDASARPTDLTEEQLLFVYAQVLARRPGWNASLFQRAMEETCPTLAAPDFTDPFTDLGLIFSLPQMERFWREWTPDMLRRKAPYAGAKAVACFLSMCGVSVHVDDAHERISNDPRMQQLFADIDRRAFVPGQPPAPFAVAPDKSCYRQIRKLGEGCWRPAVAANVAIAREMARRFPELEVGKRLLIDASLIPAWCPQRGSGNDPELEQELRRRTPEAGFRAYSYKRNGKKKLSENDDAGPAGTAATRLKVCRGYILAVISDQATGIPLVWMLVDATEDEAGCIVPLLSDLYRLWPDCPAELIVGDSAYDEDPWCRLCEVDYGIAPIFRIHPSKRQSGGFLLTNRQRFPQNPSRDGSVRGVSGEGRLICSVHGRELEYETFDRPSRTNSQGQPLRPGQTADEGRFRIRGNCTHASGSNRPCGRIGLRASVDWSLLTRYPHYPDGGEKLYWKRQALLIRLNGIEAIFNRLKTAGLGIAGAARARVLPRTTIEQFISLSLLGMTALTYVDQLQQHGMPVNVPAPAPLPAPAAPTPEDETKPDESELEIAASSESTEEEGAESSAAAQPEVRYTGPVVIRRSLFAVTKRKAA